MAIATIRRIAASLLLILSLGALVTPDRAAAQPVCRSPIAPGTYAGSMHGALAIDGSNRPIRNNRRVEIKIYGRAIVHGITLREVLSGPYGKRGKTVTLRFVADAVR